MLQETTSADFQDELKNQTKTILVFVWAPWCSNCKILKPVIEEIASEYPDKYQILKLNGDENKEFIQKYKVFGLPTTLVFCHGLLVDRKTGIQSKAAIMKRIRTNDSMTAEEAKDKEISGFFSWPFKKSKTKG